VKIERRFIPADEVELRMDGEDPVIEGHAAVFNKWADIGGMFRERIAPGAFTESIENDDIRALVNHDPNMLYGRNKNGTHELVEDKKGLLTRTRPNMDTTVGRDAVAWVKRGDMTGQSFGFSVLEDSWQTKDIEGRGPVDHRTIKKVRTYDTGIVTYPAYEQTDIVVRSAQEVYEEHRKQEAPDGSEGNGEEEAAGRTQTPHMTSKGNALALREREARMG